MFRMLIVPLFMLPALLAFHTDVNGGNASAINETSHVQGRQSTGGERTRQSETLVFSAANVSASNDCPRGFTRIFETCYFLGTNKVTWYEALTICQFVSDDANLSEIRTPYDQHLLRNLTVEKGEFGEYWVGATNFTQVEYRWYKSGYPLDEKIWDTNEPNNAGNFERCAELRHNGKLNDNDCHARRNYICTKPAK